MLLFSTLTAGLAQGAAVVSNTSPQQQFVAVAPNVKLEVLDWGGSGRNLVLLAGGGNTAHVFATLAPKLAKHFTFMESLGAELACPLPLLVDIQQDAPETMSSRFLMP